jgi:hypothetical protein
LIDEIDLRRRQHAVVDPKVVHVAFERAPGYRGVAGVSRNESYEQAAIPHFDWCDVLVEQGADQDRVNVKAVFIIPYASGYGHVVPIPVCDARNGEFQTLICCSDLHI